MEALMTTKEMLRGALILAATWGCVIDTRKDSGTDAGANDADVIGTYVANDSGTTLGKHWCYSGALVLDSTKHFGSVITMCGDDGPATERLKGTYTLRKTTVRVDGQSEPLSRLNVVLKQDGSRRKTHTLLYDAGSLRFDEPWWLGAGLRALDIPDPTLKRVSETVLADTSGIPKASSTPAVAKSTGQTSAKKSSPRPAAK
jgi:hypothetical protein